MTSLPPRLLELPIQGIYRLERSLSHAPNPAAGIPGHLVLYDAAFAAKADLARILSHELAHELHRQLPDRQKFDYLRIARWQILQSPDGRGFRLVPLRDSFVAGDGVESPAEDFSNNVEYFLHEPQALLKKSPEIHRWIRETLGADFKLGGAK